MIEADTLQTAPTAPRSGFLPDDGSLDPDGFTEAEKRHMTRCTVVAVALVLFLMIVGGALAT